jgi:hypothetical protein
MEEKMPCKTQVINNATPRTSITPENITAVRDLIEGDRLLTGVEICQELGTRISYGSVQSIIKNVLLFQNISAQWVPSFPHSRCAAAFVDHIQVYNTNEVLKLLQHCQLMTYFKSMCKTKILHFLLQAV